VSATLRAIAVHIDAYLDLRTIPDYPNALNGIQIANRGSITRLAAAVDVSRKVIRHTVDSGANLLLVHHGVFWGGVQPLRGAHYERLKMLLENDIAVYSAHLPLDAHAAIGNNVLLATQLGLTPQSGFAEFQGFQIGVQGEAAVATSTLLDRAQTFARQWGGEARATDIDADRVTRRWAICSGGGASAATLNEATAAGIDTLIVGEGPHWTAVDAPDLDLAIIYAGHYATETLGVRALAAHVGDAFDLPWSFIHAPTGL
jgi:dinuclear metal center YbgI/SA1388 family protein